MDNKVVKNPLLSGVDHAAFQDIVQIVPAAPSIISKINDRTTGETEEKRSEKKETHVKKFDGGHHQQEDFATPSAIGVGRDTNRLTAKPILLPTSQNIPAVGQTFKEVQLDQPVFSSNQSAPLANSENPFKSSGPPPLTSFRRPLNKSLSSRYPTSNFLQTIPTAQQFVSQTNTNIPVSFSAHNFQSIPPASSSDVTCITPEQQVLQPSTSSPQLHSISSNPPLYNPHFSNNFKPSILNPNDISLLGSTSSSVLQSSDAQASLSSHSTASLSFHCLTNSSVFTPNSSSQPPAVNPGSSLPQNSTPSQLNQPDINTSITSLPVSQPVIIASTILSPTSEISVQDQPSLLTSADKNPHSNSASSSPKLSSDKVLTTSAPNEFSPALFKTSASENSIFLTPPSAVPLATVTLLPSAPSLFTPNVTSFPAKEPSTNVLSTYSDLFYSSKLTPAVTSSSSATPGQKTTAHSGSFEQTAEQNSFTSSLPNSSATTNSSTPVSSTLTGSFSCPPAPLNKVSDFFVSSADEQIKGESPFSQFFANKPPVGIAESAAVDNSISKNSLYQNIPNVNVTSEASATLPSLNQQAPEPSALYTFPAPTVSTSFNVSLTHPPKIPYNDNKFSVFSKQSKPSEPNVSLESKPVLSPSQSLSNSNSPSPQLPKEYLTPASSEVKLGSLLYPSKVFTQPLDVASEFIPTQSQVAVSAPAAAFTSLPTRKFTTPNPSGFPSLLPATSKPEDIVAPTVSTHITAPLSTDLSLTPPPPYSSLASASTAVDKGDHPDKGTTGSVEAQQPDTIKGAAIIKNTKTVVEEELDQIPLDENTVPLYNPVSVRNLPVQSLAQPLPGSGNTYRLGKGLKRPSYAPVPDLGLSHQVDQIFPAMATSTPLQNPLSSLPANLTGLLQSAPASSANVTTPSTTPSSSVTSSSPPPESSSFHFSITAQGQIYRPAYHHWFYKKGGEKKSIWFPFTMADSLSLEQVFTSPDLSVTTKVPTDGGRYDVEVVNRCKVAVYWEEPPGEVRRCSWFVRAPIESRYIPYDENIAEILEDAYKTGCLRNEWSRRVELADGEVIILHSPNAMEHHQRSSSPDAWGNPPAMQQKPRVVKRGLEDFDISEGEPNQVDNLVLVVHGIGKVCDLRFRSLVQVVDDFRGVSLQLVQSHFRSGVENGNVGRVEVLPVEWHRALHSETIDKRLSDITLPSIPKAREFTNDVLLDILFYTSPVFCERIVQAVGAEINRVYSLYMSRNPGFRGGVSLGGHSLGSLILFDMLCHQKPHRSLKSSFSPQSSIHESDEDMPELGCLKAKARLSRRMSYLTIGNSGTGQPYIMYPQLAFQPKAFFALGSPIGMFLTVRGIEGLGEEFRFPTCPKFFNIFHPYDPVAYRIEPLITADMVGVPAVVIPHHKGRKRMHLELADTMAQVTAALKQKLLHSVKSTWNTVYQLAMFHRPDSSIQQEVNQALENEMLNTSDCESIPTDDMVINEQEALNMKVGSLNGGDRIDYVLQEAPLETFNQYISAVRSHVVYWESEDTMLLILKELYATIGVSPDSQVPQPILPFDLSSETGNETYSEYTDSIGAPPTQFTRK